MEADLESRLRGYVSFIDTNPGTSSTMSILVRLSRSYFAGLCRYRSSPNCSEESKRETMKKQKAGLDGLISAATACASTLYNSHAQRFIQPAPKISEIEPPLKEFASSWAIDFQNNIISGSSTYKNFQDTIRKSAKDLSIDAIVYVSGGGLEPACIASNELNCGTVVPVKFSPYKNRDSKVFVPDSVLDYLFKSVAGKKVLVVDDWLSSGMTMRTVLEFVGNLEPHRLYGSAVITSVSPVNIKGIKSEIVPGPDRGHNQACVFRVDGFYELNKCDGTKP